MRASPPLRWALLAAAVVLSSVLVLRAFNPAPHTGGDNAGYVALAHALVTDHAYVDASDPARLPHTKYPPVFPAALALLMLLGARTWVAFKAFVGVSTVASVALTYLWAERRAGPWTGFAVAVLVAASSAVVYYSHWILSDPLFVAFTLLALWALERADADETSSGWLALGVGAAALAYFTRSAGLPLLVALLAWLALRRRWRALAVSAIAIGVPAGLWWLRGRVGGLADYGTEFWLVDPYDPARGTVGIGGLIARAGSNSWAYLSAHGPGGIVGVQGPQVTFLGLILTGASLHGWVIAMRARVGAAELFLPLYVGLIVLWPEVWGGDRFVLPLLPLVFLYGALAGRALGARLGSAGPSVVVCVAVAGMLIPAAGAWLSASREAAVCAGLVARSGPFGCYGPRVVEFADAAEWMGRALPEGSVVMTRKPRIFYALSGIPSRTFPFNDDPAVQLALADEVGARYVLLDQWDGLASRYVGGAVRRQPGAFCILRGFGAAPGQGAQLLGILPPGERGVASTGAAESVALGRCPEGYASDSEEPAPSRSGSPLIPLLLGATP